MKKLLACLSVFLVLSAEAHVSDPDPRGPLIQIALLLDTSNSMDGLIGQAKVQLWRVVNDMAASHCRHRSPRIQVALYEYGNSGLAAGEHYLRQVSPFTSDLDRVSEKLFGLSTNGGEEYCGAVIKDAARNLNWDDRYSTYKAIFIAGNEPFTQGDVNFRNAIEKAGENDIVVNTIFCGNRREGVQTLWKEGADRGHGAYMTINQDAALSVARSPYDDRIESLGQALNNTYVFYGAEGRGAAKRQESADKMAMAAAPAGAAVERSLFKSKGQYNQSLNKMDAVGSVASGQKKVSEFKKEDLPAEYRDKDVKAIEADLKLKSTERERIQKELEKLGKDRADFLSRQASGQKDTLDKAILEAARAQAGAKGFVFSEK